MQRRPEGCAVSLDGIEAGAAPGQGAVRWGRGQGTKPGELSNGKRSPAEQAERAKPWQGGLPSKLRAGTMGRGHGGESQAKVRGQGYER